MQGYIKDYRQELKSDIWQMPPLYHRTWQWLKYNVNHDDGEIPMRDGTKMLIKKGQRLTSVRDIAKEIGWYEGYKRKEPNPKTISTILEWMEKQGMISIDRGKGNRQYTLITLANWEIYQAKNNEGNSSETAREQSADINKNVKNDLRTISSSATTTEPETLDEVHRQIFGHYNMTGLLSGFVIKYKGKGFTDAFIREVWLEAAETSSNGGKPNIRQIESIAERWERDGIYSRAQNKAQKESGGDEKPRGFPQNVRPIRNSTQSPTLPDDELDEIQRAQAGM